MTFLLVHWSTTTRYNRFHISHFCKIENSYLTDVKSVGKQNYCDKFLLCKILRLVIIETLWTPLFKLENIFWPKYVNAIKKEKASWLTRIISPSPDSRYCHRPFRNVTELKWWVYSFPLINFPRIIFATPFAFIVYKRLYLINK